MAIASEFEVYWSVEESLLHVYKTPIWKIGDLICCNNRMSSLRPDLDTKVVCTRRLGPTFLELSMWNLVAMCKIKIVVIHKLMDLEMYFGNADLGLKFER